MIAAIWAGAKAALGFVSAYRTLALAGGAAVLALGLWAYVNGLRADLAQARANATTATAAAQANALSLIEVRADAAAREAALVRATRALEARIAHLAPLRAEIEHAPTSDDGPVAPVLRRVLDGLRGNPAGAADPDHSPVGAAEPAGLPRGAGPAAR